MSSLPKVLLHGHSLDPRMWQPQLGVFDGCIAPALRGYHDGLPAMTEFSYCTDLAASLEPAKFHLVGLSLGGNIALEFALCFPERVASLVLLDSSLKGFAPDAAQLAVAAQVANAFEVGGLEAARAAWLAAPLFAAARENTILNAQLEAWVQDYSGWHWAHGISPSAAIEDVSNRLSEVRAKTLIVVGQRDTSYFHNVAKYLRSGILGSRLEEIKAAGHLVNLEQPEVVNQLLAAHWATSS
jgi:3-oxoadipate enol-lactonase